MTIGSGGSGGVFAPSLVIGGMLGGVFGQGLHQIVPELVTQPGAYVMIGMATFFTAVANVPITATIMISEMTGSYTLLVPLIFSGVIAHLFARRWSLYTQQMRNYSESPAHRLELTPDLVSDLTVSSITQYPVYYHSLYPTNTLDEIVSVFTRTREVVLPVVDPASEVEGRAPRYTGLVVLDVIQPFLREEDVVTTQVIIAEDVSVPFVSVSLTDTVDVVLDTFDRVQYPELPVVDADGLIVGFLRAGQVLAEYRRAYLRKKRETLPV
jgi:CIC family chloride channel protein